MKTNQDCRPCAYHESGYILFAYLCGYTCQYAELINPVQDEDYTSIAIIDFGKDRALANQFMDPGATIEQFQGLTLAEKLECIEIGQRLSRMYIGGSVAAAVYRNHGNPHVPLPVQMELTDLDRISLINEVIRRLSSGREEDLMEHGLQEALYTLANINIWNAIEQLANLLMEKRQLNQNDIEESLESCGISFQREQPSYPWAG